MQFRRRLFYALAILAALATVAFVASALADTPEEVSLCGQQGIEGMNDCQTGVDAIQVMIVLCLGLPFVLFFGMLGWRNAAGLRTEERHQEALSAASSEFGSF